MIVCQNNLPNGLKIPIGKGARYSIIHAGSKDGFVPNAELILVNKELNGENFEKWISEQLLPNIPKQSIIVLDNAPTHSKRKHSVPTQQNNKKFITEWLTERKIPFPENALKIELLKIVEKNSPKKTYSVDELIRENGHIPLRLPPYHCDLNPIELIWGQAKHFFGKNNFNCNLNSEK